MDYLPHILIALFLLMLGFQFLAGLSMRRQEGEPLPHLGDLLDDHRAERGRLLFYFYSERCGACRPMSPIIEALAEEFPGQVFKIDIDDRPGLARAFRIMGTPTGVGSRDGVIERVLVGAAKEARLRELL